MRDNKLHDFVKFVLLAAIILIMFLVPFLGYIPLGFMKATLIHIPVIVGSIVLGAKYGGLLGFLFGLTSLIANTVTNPSVTSFVFSPFYSVGGVGGNGWSLVICFVPRILVGIVPHYVYKAFRNKHQTVALAVSGVAGSLTNTLLVMNFIYLFFGEAYAEATGRAIDGLYKAIMTIIVMNGVPEAIVASIITVAICKALLKLEKK